MQENKNGKNDDFTPGFFKNNSAMNRCYFCLKSGALHPVTTQRLKQQHAFAFSVDGRKFKPPVLRVVVDAALKRSIKPFIVTVTEPPTKLPGRLNGLSVDG